MTQEAPRISLLTTAVCDEGSCPLHRTPGIFDPDIYTMGTTIGGDARVQVFNCTAHVQGRTPTIGNGYCDIESEGR
jgi:hypothetical protein